MEDGGTHRVMVVSLTQGKLHPNTIPLSQSDLTEVGGDLVSTEDCAEAVLRASLPVVPSPGSCAKLGA